MTLLLVLLVACTEPPPAPADLRSTSLEERRLAFMRMDREDMVASMEDLLELARHEPDAELQREVVRQIGYSRDPRARAFLLELAQASPLQAVAIESLGYDIPEGCDALAQMWIEAHAAGPVDPTREGLLLHVFKVTSPACRDALRRVDPEAVRYMPGEATSL